MKILSLISIILASCLAVFAGNGYDIEVTLEGFDEQELYLAYYYGDNQYLADTAKLENGSYTFSGEEDLDPGVYMIVLPPDNNFIQIIINEGEQQLTISGNTADLTKDVFIEGSSDNQLFYEYLAFLNERRDLVEQAKAQLEASTEETEQQQAQQKLDQINEQVKEKQKELIRTHPETMTAAMIKAGMDVEIPDFQGTKEEVELMEYRFYREHYFDNIDFLDPRTIRAPFLHQRVDYYINKLTYQIPDSLNLAIDEILKKFEPESDGFKFYLVYFLNYYAKSKIVGMDAVYVHLVDNYYAKGLATWTDEEQLNKIIKNAGTLKPILIGQPAPPLRMQDQNGEPVLLYDVVAEFTILYFWDPDCGHCKKSLPKMIEFFEAYKEKDIEIFSVCTRLKDEAEKCWDAVEEKEIGSWVNVTDPYLRSRYKQIYDVRTTPMIYVLDKDKKIVMKKVGAEQLPEIMEQLMELNGD